MKNLINKIKEELKSQAAEQRFIKGQRKTEHLVGERKISHWEAAEQARENKYKLSIEYVAYYILKHRLEEPVIEETWNTSHTHTWSRKTCSNMETVKESIKGCCGENCHLLKNDYVFVEIAEVIRKWKEVYKEDEVAES